MFTSQWVTLIKDACFQLGKKMFTASFYGTKKENNPPSLRESQESFPEVVLCKHILEQILVS